MNDLERVTRERIQSDCNKIEDLKNTARKYLRDGSEALDAAVGADNGNVTNPDTAIRGASGQNIATKWHILEEKFNEFVKYMDDRIASLVQVGNDTTAYTETQAQSIGGTQV